jgi:hypothetical protein
MDIKAEHFKEFERNRLEKKRTKYNIEWEQLSKRAILIQKEQTELLECLEQCRPDRKGFLHYLWNGYKIPEETKIKEKEYLSKARQWNFEMDNLSKKIDKFKAEQAVIAEKK